MSIRNWLRRWKHRRGWKRADRLREGPLREFVYLDEVSVYSLVASQVGMIVTELTDTQATSLQSEVSGGIGASGPFARAEVGSRVQTGESSGSQVLRKAIIQTTFKQLHETATRSGALRQMAPPEGATPPSATTLEDIQQIASDDPRSPWVIPPGRIRRGDLVEMEVRLEAEPMFEAWAITSWLVDIVQDDPAAFGIAGNADLGDLRLASRLLDRMLADLVPMRGRALDYRALQLGNDDWLVHDAVAQGLADDVGHTRTVNLVGVAEQGRFWQDVRRVLFSGSTFRVMARITQDGLQSSWTPVKLADVVRNVHPGLADIIDDLNRQLIPAMSAAAASADADTAERQVREAILTYATMLAGRADVDVTEDEMEKNGLFDVDPPSDKFAVAGWRAIFAPVAQYVEAKSDRELKREVAADYRVAALTRTLWREMAGSTGTPFPAATPPADDERFLDSEVVAVYW